jgi:hypothetical protein
MRPTSWAIAVASFALRKDIITDTTTTTDDNMVLFSNAITANLTIDLRADTRYDVFHDVFLPGVTDASGTNTIDWSGDVISFVGNGSSGDDYVFGNEGRNFLISRSGWDHVYGFGGDDHIRVADRESADIVDCGAGYDSGGLRRAGSAR